MKTAYYWKELSVDGLLKEPAALGPRYDEKELNKPDGWNEGFESEGEALAALETWKGYGDYVLIKIYRK